VKQLCRLPSLEKNARATGGTTPDVLGNRRTDLVFKYGRKGFVRSKTYSSEVPKGGENLEKESKGNTGVTLKFGWLGDFLQNILLPVSPVHSRREKHLPKGGRKLERGEISKEGRKI